MSVYPVKKVFCFYSDLSAVTGSFFAAFFDGISPPISVSITLNTIRISAATGGILALMFSISVSEWIIVFAGISVSNDTPIPRTPDIRPMINVSALNT